jgi:nucleoside 2-deoxyribosyltransferase
MMRLYVCGSSKFLHEIEELECRLKEKNIKYETSKKMNSRGILGCLKKVDDADIVYVVNPQGYVGKSVSFDLGYAYAKNKPIFVMNPVDDPPITNLTNGVLSPKALVDLLKGTP